ncbi:patatin-like phospholipase family protein [Rhodopirellula sp. JC740]|uniref:Patatin-like phospholipase family protein n=1 Tax=Rhodopirellula halodulae TaxID=2894198 RepID=A0ABS8NEY0_9BACT|nr:patatin-like phospholipase family protein [Rhodopirellula sp. JC740]MCC9642083.1 patatin-like phospholipase family protein [Rhodopirellula sp. JC740]
MKIALAFSGGGVRATVFHLGVLARLARENLLGNVSSISSVSGGSLAAGLVFATTGHRWPSSHEYLHEVVPEILRLLTTRNLQRSYVLKSLMFPWQILSGRASVLGDELERQWNIQGDLSDLPESPRWLINATCYQTGKNWRFERDLMGDYQTKYIVDPKFRLSHALAASAAVPGLIGPLILKSKHHRWNEFRDDEWKSIPPKYKRLHLWDGGVYDNLGVEALFKPGLGLADGSDFLIVCDASRPLAHETRRSRWRPGYLKASMRLVDVATDQVRSLRARMLIEYFKQNPGTGAYLRLGLKNKRPGPQSESPLSSSDPALQRAGKSASKAHWNEQPSLTDDEVKRVAKIETTLRRLSHHEFSLLFRHGYEVANGTLARYGGESLDQIPRHRVRLRAA